MATVDIQGVQHAYELTAPTSSSHVLVFIHGWLLSRRYWQPLIDRLSPDYQCLAYDLRGFGDSQLFKASGSEGVGTFKQPEAISPSDSVAELFASQYTPAAYARDLSLLLQQLNISSAWLIGHSLGGTIALWGASVLPECVKGVVCVNAGGGIYIKEGFERFRAAGQKIIKWRPRWLRYMPGMDLLFARAMVARPLARSWGRQRAIDFAIAHPDAALGTLLDSTTEAEVNRLPNIVSRLKQPVYFITGVKDTVMEPKYVMHLASFHRLFQGCGDNVIQLSDCGHLSMLEQPDAVSFHIRSFLSAHIS